MFDVKLVMIKIQNGLMLRHMAVVRNGGKGKISRKKLSAHFLWYYTIVHIVVTVSFKPIVA